MAETESQRWTIVQDGSTVLEFTSMLEMSRQSDSSLPEEALESGSFAAYNRTHYSDVLSVKLAIEGTDSELQQAQETLEKLKEGSETFSLVTPDFEHENLALERYDYGRNLRQGSGLLVVDLRLKEIRKVETATATLTVARCKDGSNVTKESTGRTQTTTVSDSTTESINKRSSILADIVGSS